MNSLICCTVGGLGNRLPCLLSLCLWARRLDRKLVVAWSRATDCEAGFHDLFEWEGGSLEVIDESQLEAFDDLTVCTNKPSLVSRLGTVFGHRALDRRVKGGAPVASVSELPRIAHSSIAVVADRPVLMTFDDLRPVIKMLHPSLAVRNAMSRIPERPDERWAGIHYRATDRMGYPYREWRLRLLARRMPVFVCSDNEAIEARASEINNVFSLPKTAYAAKQDAGRGWSEGWNIVRSQQSMIDAVADLYLLASCGKLRGTEASSFFKLAKVIGGHPLDRLSPLTRRYWRRKFDDLRS